ncbi:MAG: nodulation protein NodH, partial [Paracoccaceae bacterium]
ALRQVHKVPVPDGDPAPETDPAYDMKAHRTAFLGFLKFLKSNLQAQTATRVDGSWATQLSLVQGMAEFGLPDMILREENLRVDLAMLAGQVGRQTMPKVPERGGILHDRLAAIYDAEIEAAARDAYGRDYEAFGFGDWSA